MKKSFILCAAVSAALMFASCGSQKELAYRKAYEKAKAQEAAQTQSQTTPVVEQTPVVAPVAQQTPVVTPLEDAPSQNNTSAENEPVRTENLQVVDGAGLKAYSVVVGAYTVRANAEAEVSKLKAAGYSAQLAYNQERNMYRVVISTFDNKANAVDSKSSISSKYPKAWILAK